MPDQTTETKKLVSSMYRSRDKKGYVTLAYKVTRQGRVSGLHAVDFLDLKNIRNKKNLALSCLLPEIVELWNSHVYDVMTWRHGNVLTSKFKIYWKVPNWWGCRHFMPWRHTLTSCHDVISWHFNIQLSLKRRQLKMNSYLKFDDKISKFYEMAPKIKSGGKKTQLIV